MLAALSRLVALSVELQAAEDGAFGVRPPGAPDLAVLATFGLDREGRLTSCSEDAARLLSLPGHPAAGQHVADALALGSQQRRLMHEALAEVAAGRVWTGTLAADGAQGWHVAVRCEPMPGPGDGALVIAQRAWPQPPPRLLSDAATRIGSTLDLGQTAREVTEVAVPGFADAATVYVSERLLAADEFAVDRAGEAAVVRRLAARFAGQPAAVIDGLLRTGEVVVFGKDTPFFEAMATSSPVLFDRLGGELAEELSRRPRLQRVAAAYTSFLAVPLAARGMVVGCAAFGRGKASRAYGPDDLAVAAELASRAAVCIDNARLYGRERRAALALQRSLLPRRPHVPAGLDVAHSYLPVGANVVGGDWHDIVQLPGGRATLIVGDAMGHGPEAAAVMVQLRTAAHMLADLELPAQEVLSSLDRMVQGLAGSPLATCVYAVIDPPQGSCVIAQAGHLPPVLMAPGAAPSILDLPPGLPLGVGAGSFQPTRIAFPAGATLAFYTDGLVESRNRSFDDGIADLCDALGSAVGGPGATLGDACETIVQALRQHGEDDITLVLARARRPEP